MNQNTILEQVETETIILVNPIVDNNLHINDAVLTDIEFTDAILINESNNCTNLKIVIASIISCLCVSFGLFILFIITGGLGFLLTMYGGDDTT